MPYTLYPLCSVYTDWLATSSPATFKQVKENPLLLSSNIPPTLVNSICPDISSPLLRYNENIHHAHCSMSHRFLEKYLGDNLEK